MEWISVKDKLAERNCDCDTLKCQKDNRWLVFNGRYMEITDIHPEDWNIFDFPITHWILLEPPKEGE